MPNKPTRQFPVLIGASLMSSIGLLACGEPASQTAEPAATPAADTGSGTLTIRANGEDFVRQGFITKDGWQVSFDHVYVTLADVKAYQTDPPFDPQTSETLDAKAEVGTEQAITIDLAEGDASAEPIPVAELDAPAGRYNALSWQMVSAPSGAAQGYPLVIQGNATKEGETVDFVLQISEELSFTCGDFIGDDRKGLVSDGDSGDVEATFHFDHLFGDAETPADDDLNVGALGFDPLAALAQDGQLLVDSDGLEAQLSDADYQKLMELLPSLGHVGEGHCNETKLAT